MDRYAVIGHPVAHSRSPSIHSAFAQATGQSLEYTRLLAPLDAFALTVQRFFDEGGKGLNVTLPFKQEAFALAQRRTERAQSAGAVNTLWMSDGQLWGDNTDGAGLVQDLEHNLGFSLTDRRVLLVGAGGAARGALLPLLDRRPAELLVVNRSPSKAQELGKTFGVPAGGLDEAQGRRFDVVINATSSSLSDAPPALPAGLYSEMGLAYDMFYAAQPTAFMRQAEQDGAARTADGLGMLVEQAAEAFLQWRGVRPQTGPVLHALRLSLQGGQA